VTRVAGATASWVSAELGSAHPAAGASKAKEQPRRLNALTTNACFIA